MEKKLDMYVENIFRQPNRLVLRHPVPASEYGDGFFCSAATDGQRLMASVGDSQVYSRTAVAGSNPTSQQPTLDRQCPGRLPSVGEDSMISTSHSHHKKRYLLINNPFFMVLHRKFFL
jgi:hypothetical protein